MCNAIETEPDRARNRQKIKFIIARIVLATVLKLTDRIHLMHKLQPHRRHNFDYFLKLNAHLDA